MIHWQKKLCKLMRKILDNFLKHSENKTFDKIIYAMFNEKISACHENFALISIWVKEKMSMSHPSINIMLHDS